MLSRFAPKPQPEEKPDWLWIASVSFEGLQVLLLVLILASLHC